MRKFILFYLLAIPWLACTQTDPPLVASGTYDNDVYNWTFAVGDLAIQTFQSTGRYLSQGSIQPVVGSVSAFETKLPDMSVVLYPSPTENILKVSFSSGSGIGDKQLDITDVTGRRVYIHSRPVRSQETIELSLSALPAGTYFLRLADQEGRNSVHAFQKQ